MRSGHYLQEKEQQQSERLKNVKTKIKEIEEIR